jgi:hypothetical protein
MQQKQEIPNSDFAEKKLLFSFLACTIASYALLRANGYRIAIRFYERSGGAGFNVFKKQENNQERRVFALDYHPFFDKNVKQNIWRLHYHRGQTASQISKHRPYQGGW